MDNQGTSTPSSPPSRTGPSEAHTLPESGKKERIEGGRSELENESGLSEAGSPKAAAHPAREPARSSALPATVALAEPNLPASVPPSIHKRKNRKKPRGILKPAPPPTKAFSFRRDILLQLNSRLAQQGVNVQVPIPQGQNTLGSLSGTAQGTAQAAGSILGGMLKRMSGFAAGPAASDGSLSPGIAGQRSVSSSSESPAGVVSRANVQEEERPASSPGPTKDGNSSNASWLAPTNNLPTPSSSIRPLRKVRFTVSNMAVTYPISNTIAPGDEDATRLRVEKEHREKLKAKGAKDWTVTELETLYRECCRTREEHPLKKMRSVFLEASQQDPPGLKTIDLSFLPLDRQAIEPVADLLSVDFGLNKLALENCGLTDDGLKSILHALLVSGSLPSLSLASNRKIKYHGWRFVGIFMRRAKALKYLDLSENNINKASLEHIAGALAKQSAEAKRADSGPRVDGEDEEDDGETPLTIQARLLVEDTDETSSLTSLRLENCGLRTNSLEMLAQNVRFSDLNHLSLRRNKIGQIGAVALAVMLKDYPDTTYNDSQGNSAVGELEQQQQAPSQQYTVRSPAARRSVSPALPQVPMVVSSPGGGVTRRSMPGPLNGATDEFRRSHDTMVPALNSPALELDKSALTEGERAQVQQLRQDERRTEEEAISLFHARRAKQILSTIPRVGHLLTLDLKGNDIRGGVAYLSQVLKKNRTLKVLNLSDNNIEMPGLVAIAEALKYNATLETLDLSHNPCSGPGLEGITTLRTAFTLNSNLKRLFISDTDLSSEGAIALAEFLPEAKSLIHLDLTENLQIDIAGVMALAVSVRMNKSLRCLDLNIPPNAPDFARLSQEILNSCIRNTEIAQRKAQQRGVKAPIAAPIYKSTLARAAKEKEESNRLMEANSLLEQAARTGSASSEWEKNKDKVVNAADECRLVLQELLQREEEKKKEMAKERGVRGEAIVQSELASDLLTQGRFLRDKLQRALSVIGEGDKLSRALQVNDELEGVISKLEALYVGPALVVETAAGEPTAESVEMDKNRLQAPSVIDSALSSPTFSIGSDDDEEEVEDRSNDVTTQGSAMLGLGIQEADAESTGAEVQQAAREIPTEEPQLGRQSESGMANDKARGQLSEEGEIFRRAKSLHIDDRDEEGESGEESDSTTKVAKAAATTASTAESSTDKSSTKTEVAPPRVESTSKSDEVSGEELRKELLESNVPRGTARHINEEAEAHA